MHLQKWEGWVPASKRQIIRSSRLSVVGYLAAKPGLLGDEVLSFGLSLRG